MQQHFTDDELQAEYVRIMGGDLGNLCHELQNELGWLQHKWNQFQELFQKGDDRLKILNTAAPNFFYILQKLLYEDAMLHLSRLTDPAESFGRANLSIHRLAEAISDPTLKSHIQAAGIQLQQTCEFALVWRNRRLAHTDLRTFREPRASSLPDVTSAQVEEALESLRALLQSIENHYGRSLCVSLADPWGAKSLVRYLEIAVRAKETEKHLA